MIDNTQPVKFNMAIATLIRLDKLLTYSSMKSLEGDIISWYEVLFDLRRGIAPFIKKTEFEEIESKFKLLNSKRWLYRNKKNKLLVLPAQFGRIYNGLDKLSILIQRAMNEAGILMPKSDDPRFALQD
jgi:hypothetical protein